MKQFLCVLLLIALFKPQQSEAQSACNCFLLTEQKGKLAIEKVTIENNRVEILNDPSIIAPVFSMGEGLNGDMVKKERRGGMIIAQCKDNQLKLKFKTTTGEEKPLPDMDMNVLKQMNIRLNVTGGDGNKKAFLIEKNSEVKEAPGPVMDMFGGKVPIQNGDYILTTETKKATTQVAFLKGKIKFRMKNGWMMIPVTLENGKKAEFVFDLAATSTVIDRSLLPDGVEIRKMEMIAYSEKGAVKSGAAMQGATGQVQEDFLLGKAQLQHLALDTFSVQGVDASVLKSFPEKLKQQGVTGIIGTDIIKRSAACTIAFTSKEEGVIEFHEPPLSTSLSITMPFTTAGGLLFADGSIQKVPLKFVLDTGAKETIVSKAFATQQSLAVKTLSKKNITGIDGKPQETSIIQVKELEVGAYLWKDARLILGDVAALQSYGLAGNSAILGMDFFSKFRKIQLDFTNGQLGLQP